MHGLQTRSFALSPQFRSHVRGSCVPAVITLLPGIDDADFVIEGYVLSGRLKHEHTWLEIAGIVLDPTIRQFRNLKCWSDTPIQYEILHRIPVIEYRALIKFSDSTFWQRRVMSFAGEK